LAVYRQIIDIVLLVKWTERVSLCYWLVCLFVCWYVSDSSEEHSSAAHVLGSAKSPLSLQVCCASITFTYFS